jgi:AcrR family transcriptional regulator
MVSQRGVAVRAHSRERILAAAAVEFAARGFDGAKVDRIAARARLNKAMLYYHFDDKAALYRAILLDVFTHVASAVAHTAAVGSPEERLRAFIRAIASQAAGRPHFPVMWLREIADGGRHLDAAVLAEIGRVLSILATILTDGAREGRFRPAHPLVTQMGIVAPLLLFSATAPFRSRFAKMLPEAATTLDPKTFLDHVEAATLATLRADSIPSAAPAKPRRSRR